MEQTDLGSLVSGFSIEKLDDRYRISGVLYEGRASVVDISRELLDDGAEHTQQEWVDLTREQEWRVPSGPLYHAVCTALYDNRNHADEQQRSLVDKVKQMLAKDFKDSWMMTSTRIFYNPQGKDTVVHNFGYENERRVNENIVGVNGFINRGCGFGSTTNALLGTSDGERVKAVYSWLSGKESYLCRLNSNPKKIDEHVLELGDCDRFGISADGNVNYVRWARGMVAHGAENSPK